MRWLARIAPFYQGPQLVFVRLDVPHHCVGKVFGHETYTEVAGQIAKGKGHVRRRQPSAIPHSRRCITRHRSVRGAVEEALVTLRSAKLQADVGSEMDQFILSRRVAGQDAERQRLAGMPIGQSNLVKPLLRRTWDRVPTLAVFQKISYRANARPEPRAASCALAPGPVRRLHQD